MLSNLIKDTIAGYIAKNNTEQIHFLRKRKTSLLSRVVQMRRHSASLSLENYRQLTRLKTRHLYLLWKLNR